MTEPLTKTEILLLRAAFENHVVEPNVESGFERIAQLTEGSLNETDFHAALARCLRNGLIRDPIRLPEGALQCHWRLELTRAGTEVVRQIVDGKPDCREFNNI